jgi:hypothetical protein
MHDACKAHRVLCIIHHPCTNSQSSTGAVLFLTGIQGALQLSCALSAPKDAAAAGEGAMRASMQAQIEQRDIARVQQVRLQPITKSRSSRPQLTCVRAAQQLSSNYDNEARCMNPRL